MDVAIVNTIIIEWYEPSHRPTSEYTGLEAMGLQYYLLQDDYVPRLYKNLRSSGISHSIKTYRNDNAPVLCM